MDIKLKKSKTNSSLKILAFLLCVICAVGSVGAALITIVRDSDRFYMDDIPDILFSDGYENSSAIQSDFNNKAYELMNYFESAANEEKIKSGATIQEELDSRVESWYEDFLASNYEQFILDGVSVNQIQEVQEALAYGNYTVHHVVSGVIDEAKAREAFEKEYKGQIAQDRMDLIQTELEAYRDSQKSVNETKGFRYYISDGKDSLTNVAGDGLTADMAKEVLRKEPAYRFYDMVNNVYEGYPNRPENNRHYGYYTESSLYMQDDRVYTIYMAFDQAYLNDKNTDFLTLKHDLTAGVSITLGLAAAFLVLLVYLTVVTGKRNENGEIVLRRIDRWFTDIHFWIWILAITGAAVLTALSGEQIYYAYQYYGKLLLPFSGLWVLPAAILVSIGLSSYLCLVKKLKAKVFIRDFILIRILRWIGKGIKEIYDGTTVVKKAAIIAALVCIGSVTFIFFPVMLIASVWIAVRYAKMFDQVKQGVKTVKNGNPEYKIPTDEMAGELLFLAQDINELSDGFDLAVKQELKNQRMKTELISNVSHDIKTPLTSIISYVDLLKKEGLDCPDAPKYLDILDQKSIRLKKLTEDLFEAAKASSGDVPVTLEKVDVISLLNQGLGEMNARLQNQGLEVILNTQEEKHMVMADGQLLWRVVENVLGNVIKYALENSRVYIDVKHQLDMEGNPISCVEVKNISKNPLNIPADELMERFKRGDEARATEGSGLGLSIAKDLMQIQGGSFYIVIDGDLFKAVFTLHSCKDEA